MGKQLDRGRARYTGLTVGPLVGGVLVAAIDPRWVFAANAVSFLGSVALVVSVRGDFADPEREDEDAQEHRGLAAGFRFIARDRVLKRLLLSWTVFILGMASTLIADPILADEFGWGPFGYGLITSCWVAERSSVPGSVAACGRTGRACG